MSNSLDAGDLYNRNEFLGAMNFFLIKTIQDAKAALSDKNYRIVIINHHNRGKTASSERNVVTAQENLAKYWGFRTINVADNVGVNPSTLWMSLTASGDGLHFVTGSNLEKTVHMLHHCKVTRNRCVIYLPDFAVYSKIKAFMIF